MICQTASPTLQNIVLIDFENVQPDSLVHFANGHFRVLVFVGVNQTKLPIEVAASLQRLGTKAEYIRISGSGPNALDFHIAYYIGVLAAEDPTARFHIVSNDTGFDPLIAHLKSKNIFVARVKGELSIPRAKAVVANSSAHRLALAVAKLRQLKSSRPASVKTLESTITSLFNKELKLPVTAKEVSGIVKSLVDAGHIAVNGTSVTYPLRSGCS
jgi:hypothetical protein